DHTSFGLLPAQPRGCAGGERRRAAREQGCGQEYRQRSTHGILRAGGEPSLNVKNSPIIPVATLQHRCSLPLRSCMGRACLASYVTPRGNAGRARGRAGGLAGWPGIHTIWVARSTGPLTLTAFCRHLARVHTFFKGVAARPAHLPQEGSNGRNV